MNELISVVDDERDIIRLITLHLKQANYRVSEFIDATSFMTSLKSNVPDLLILDLMLPDHDGLDICKFLKREERFNTIPIIMLTARAEETDKIIGLELGADDYVTKPFSPKELVARVKAVLRRQDTGDKSNKINIGDFLEMDLQKYSVSVDSRKVDLTTTEFRILHLLASRVGWVYSRERILDHLWGNEKIVLDRTVDVHIKHLREKLGEYGSLIKNVRGVGYKLEL
jgi:two-component system phosphate regulon response regulator PhoB/two-component system alkaline phosphatase synthesis response regulator PhoP